MFKLCVLWAFFAAAAAEPGALIAAPWTQYSTFLTPGATTIARQDSSVIHPSPLVYQAPLAYTHFIKKRSPQFPLTYAAPATYYAASTYNTPLIHSAQILPAPIGSVPLHLIKKRSAVPALFAPSTYAVAAPVVASTYAATAPIHTPLISQPLISQPLISHPLISQPLISQPLLTHLIKKRSAGLLNTYIAPTSYSHQSRFDWQATHTPLSSISYASPAIAYPSSLAYSSPLARLY